MGQYAGENVVKTVCSQNGVRNQLGSEVVHHTNFFLHFLSFYFIIQVKLV